MFSKLRLRKDWNNMLIKKYKVTKNNRTVVMKIDKGPQP